MSKKILEYQPSESRAGQATSATRQWIAERLGALLVSILVALLVAGVIPIGWTIGAIVLRLLAWLPIAALLFGGIILSGWLFERLIENNYKTLLVGRYLRRRRIAWWSLLAVMLCTMMVLVVISVMGGWLAMFENSFHGLTGDIVVESNSLAGFPWYQEMIDRMQQQPGIEAAVPTIETFGLINIGNLANAGVRVMGIPIERIGKVNRFPESLWLQHNRFIEEAKEPGTTPEQRQLLQEKAREHAANPSFKLPLPPEAYRDALPNQKGQTDVATYSGMIPGSMVVGIHRESNGQTVGRDPLLYITPVKLTTIAIRPHSFGVDVNDKSERIYWIVDDSHTGLWQYDNSFVYVPFEQLQTDLRMTAEDVLDPETGKKIGQEPARTSEIHVKVKDGYDLNQAKSEVEQVVRQVFAANKANVGTYYPEPKVQTWREKQAVWINAIQNEELLTVFLFAIISLVAIFLIFCIFYMIVVEKTKDIGIIKSVGATSSGVAGIFLGYGLAIGIVGALLGLLVSYLIVHNINELHTALGKLFGIQIWNPEVYLFDKIPNTMRWRDVLVIVPIAIVSSVLGALLPAIRAARLHPVESLRWE